MYANKCFLRWHTFLLYVPRISLVYPDILQDGCNHNQKRQQRMSIVVKIIKCFLLDAHLYSIWRSCNNFGVSDSLKWIELFFLFITIIFNITILSMCHSTRNLRQLPFNNAYFFFLEWNLSFLFFYFVLVIKELSEAWKSFPSLRRLVKNVDFYSRFKE